MAKYTLQNDLNLFDFVLLGIASAENQYVLVNSVNQELSLSLELDQVLKIGTKQGRVFDFSVYGFFDEDMGLEYFLLPNKSNYQPKTSSENFNDLFASIHQQVEEASLLVPELPHTNYFLILKGESAFHEQYTIFKSLKAVSGIQQVHEIIPERLASKNHLVF